MVTSSIRYTVWFAAAAALGAFVALFAARVPIPRPATPFETVVVQQAAQLNAHLPLYSDAVHVAPGVSPVVPAIAALGLALFGSALVTARVLTLVAMLGVAAWLLAIIRRESSSWTFGIAGAGLLLAGYALLGGPLGAARPEPLMMLLLLTAGDALLRGHGVHGAINAGVLAAVAVLTHGAALAVAALLLLHLAVTRRSDALAFGISLAFVYGGAHVLLSLQTGPWYNYETYDAVAMAIAPAPLSLLRYVGQTLLGPLNVLALTTLMAFALPVKPWQGTGGTWACIAGGLLMVALIATQMHGAGPEPAILSVMALALAGPLSMQRVTRHLAAWPGSTRLAGQSMVLTALALQFVVLAAHMPAPRF